MNARTLQERIRGWLPKEPTFIYASKAAKPRWRRPVWIAVTLTALIALGFTAYVGIQTYIRYSNPQGDITASYFEKSLNCTSAKVGDIVEVTVFVYWHGYVFPEFKRQVQIIDSYPEGNFELVSGNTTRQYNGYGGGDQSSYLLRVVDASDAFVELPKPSLYIDGAVVPLSGQSPSIELAEG